MKPSVNKGKYTPLTLIFLLLLCVSSYAQTEYFTADSVYKFAEHLYNEGDYIRAAGEFQRYLLLIKDPIHRDAIIFKIGMCYRLGGQYERAINFYQKIIDEYPESNYKEPASYEIGYTLFKMGKYNQSIKYSIKYREMHPSESMDYANKHTILRGINYLYLKDWEKAKEIFSLHISNNTSSVSLATELHNLSTEGMQLPYKSKTIAAIMSAAIPGTGKIYAGRTYDGLVSFISVGLMTWLAYDGFHKDGTRSLRGWIFGSLGTVFYLGNIYGSTVAVKAYNDQQEEKLLNKVKLFIDVNF